MAETQEKKNILQDFTEHLIKNIEENKAPWQKPWKAGALIHPFNGKTERHYNGFNNVHLLDFDFNDPRWMTFRQANDLGLKIKRGEKSTKIRFCDFTATLPVLDDAGNPVLDDEGKPQMEKYLTTSPKVIIYSVFNGTQIEGIEPYVRQEPDWNPIERVEKLLADLGEHVNLVHNQRDGAHLAGLNKIELPARSSFESAEQYYDIALHEYSHWVAYQGKTPEEIQALNAVYKTPEGRAKEEMIADITCMLLARDLYLDYNPQNNIAYIASWSKMLKDTPFELYRITAEAERRKGQLLGLERQQEQVQSVSLGEEKAATVVKIDPGIIPVALSDTRALSKWLREQYQGMIVEIADDGAVQQFTRRGLEASVKRRDDGQRQMYAGLDDLVRNSVFSDFEKADARHEGKVAGQNIYYAAANINDEFFAVRIKIDMPLSDYKLPAYKDHKISEIEIAPSLYRSSPKGLSTQEDAILKISLSVLKKDVNPSILQDGVLSKDLPGAGSWQNWDKENQSSFAPLPDVLLSEHDLELARRWDAIHNRRDATYDNVIRAEREFNVALDLAHDGQISQNDEESWNELRSFVLTDNNIDKEYLENARDLYVKVRDQYSAYEKEKTSIESALGDKLEFYKNMEAQRRKDDRKELESMLYGSRTPDAERQQGSGWMPDHAKWIEQHEKNEAAQAKTPQIAEEKTILAVPFTEKNQAKKLGAKWDKENKVWFAPAGTDLTPLAKWIPNKEALRGLSASDVPGLSAAGELAKAIQDMGGDLQGKMPVMDSKIHRIPGIGRPAGNKDFAYCAHNDAFPAGWMQNHASDKKIINWQYSGHQLSDEQKAQLQAESAIQREERANVRKAEYDKAAEKCADFFFARSPAHSNHPYLTAKGVDPDGINVTADGKALIVPLYNTQGQIRSLQYINSDGSKMLASGAEKGGNFGLVGCHINDLPAQHKVLIAEGYATAKSLNMATGLPVVISVDIGNMPAVAENIRALMPNAELVICADNDHSHKLPDGKLYNIGVDKGKIVADQVKGKLAIPYLTPADKAQGLKDFNDIHYYKGRDAVKEMLNNTRKAEVGLSR
ncbi:MAG: ssDNA-binding domain-containing protein [Deltaproteobacteria bacterium]|nr:ssDNA-binding domain-containing protein [Deltaproteobacteria bacterium]